MAASRLPSFARRGRLPGWLVDHRGRRYRLPRTAGAVAFEVMHQAAEGHLWRRVLDRTGLPVRLPLDVTQPEFLAAVGDRPGALQLVPVNSAGAQRGDPPQMLRVRPAMSAGAPAGATISTATDAPPSSPGIVVCAQGRASAVRPTGATVDHGRRATRS